MTLQSIYNMLTQIYRWVSAILEKGYDLYEQFPNRATTRVIDTVMDFTIGDSSHTVYSVEDIDSDYWQWVRNNRPDYSTAHKSDADIIRDYQNWLTETFLEEYSNELDENDIFDAWTDVKKVYKILK